MIHIGREGVYSKAPMWTVLFVCVFSFVVLLVFRVIYSVPIEIDGDSVGKWFSASNVARSGEWRAIGGDHHQLRWSIMVPQILVAKILPWRYENYYVLPMLFYSLFTMICMLVLLTGLKKREWLGVLLLAVTICIDPISHVMASQLKTVVFGLFYFVLGVLGFLYYLECRRVWVLALSVGLFFFAYGAHITYIIFSLAPLLVLTIHLKEYRTAGIFLAMLLFLFAAEALLTGVFLGASESQGRLQSIVSGATHQPIRLAIRGNQELEYVDLLARWRGVPKYNFLVLIGYLFGTGLLLIKRMRHSVPIGIWLFFYAAGIYGFAMTFPVVGIDPLRLAIALHTRYLAPFFPLALVFIVWMLFYYSRWIKSLNWILPIGFSLILTLVFIGGSLSYRCYDELSPAKAANNLEGLYCHSFRYSQNQNIYPAPDVFLFRAQRYYEDFSRDYVDGKISIFPGTRISILSSLIRFKEQAAIFTKTPKGWYSIDGKDKEWCVTELGQVENLRDNYLDCTDKGWLEEELGWKRK